MAIYMKFGSVNGVVTTEGFDKWIELSSFQLGIGRGISSAARGATNREGSEPSISEVVVTKRYDSASIGLFQDAVGGNMDSKVELKFTTTTKDKVQTYLAIELTDTGLSGYSVNSGGDTPSESLSLNFTKIVITHTAYDPKGTGKPATIGYDLTKMKKV